MLHNLRNNANISGYNIIDNNEWPHSANAAHVLKFNKSSSTSLLNQL